MYIIVSDLHIGSRHFKYAQFLSFLGALPSHATLIFNGDTFDGNWNRVAAEPYSTIIGLLKAVAKERRLILIAGNHDADIRVHMRGAEYRKYIVLYDTLYVSHGDDFDNVMPRNRTFVTLFRWVHGLRVRLGATPIHVAQYAKRWRPFYRFLRRNVMLNAVEHAREQGYATIACGHVHHPEDSVVEGVRYINSGCWTEDELYYIRVDREDVSLVRYQPGDVVR